MRGLLLGTVVAIAVVAAPAAATPTYTGVNLTTGTDAGGQPVSALRADGVNDFGHVVGQATFNGAAHPVGFFYDSSGHFDALNGLPLQGNGSYYGTGAVDINGSDYVVGNAPLGTNDTSDPTGDQHAVGWHAPSAAPTDLGVLDPCPLGVGQSSDDSVIFGVNNGGIGVGRAFYWDCTGSTFPQYRAVQFTGSGVSEVPGNTSNTSSALAIDDAGTIAILDPNNSSQSILLPGGTSIPLAVARPHGMSNDGHYLVGFGSGGAKEWHDGTVTALPPLPGDSFAQALAVNDSGDVVGASYNGNTPRAVIWQNQVPTNLNTVTTGGPYLAYPTDISDSGIIVGDGTAGGAMNAPPVWRLTPPLIAITDTKVPEPAKGSTPAVLHVTINQDPPAPVTMDWATADDTATVADKDYTAASGTLTFAPGGPMDQTVSVDVNATGEAKASEDFKVVLSNPSAPWQFAKDTGKVTIIGCKDPDSTAAPCPDVAAEDLEITQGVQKDTWETPGAVSVPGYGSVTGGTYAGVGLVTDVATVVRLYANTVTVPRATPVPAVDAVLHGYAGGHELPGSPLAATQTRTLPLGPVLPAARTDPAGAYTFVLPPAWTEKGALTLAAEVNPKVGEARPINECATCTDDDVRALAAIPFTPTDAIRLRPFAINYSYDLVGGGGRVPVQAKDLSSLYDRAKDLLPLAPGNLKIDPFPASVMDLTAGVNKLTSVYRKAGVKLTKPDLSDCKQIPQCATDLFSWEFGGALSDITPPTTPHTYDVGYSPVGNAATNQLYGIIIMGPHTPDRPLTSAAHELLHAVGFAHASACGGGGANGQIAAPWPPDEKGYIQGVGLDRRPGSGGSGLYRIIAPGVFQPQWYDLMSYCANTVGDPDSWISTRNWDRFLQLDAPGNRRRAAAPSTADNVTVFAAVGAGPGGDNMQATETNRPLTPSTASAPASIVELGAGGKVLRKVGVTPTQITTVGLQIVSATVPASAKATTFQARVGAKVVQTLKRPSPRPRVKLRSPKRKTRPKRGALLVRWKAHGARHVTLTAKVQVRPAGAKLWTTVAAGLVASKLSVPTAAFGGAKSGRVRVLIGDGFSTAKATSATVTLRK